MLKKTPNDKAELLQTLSYLEPDPKHKRELLVDISGIKRYNSRTGIPRVVLNQLQALQTQDQEIFRVRAIYLSEYPGTAPLHFYQETNKPISLQEGTIIYNPDLDPKSIKEASIYNLYKCYKNIGVYIATLIHDILPITHPHFFVEGQDQIHKEWLTHILDISDLLITTSTATKDALLHYEQIDQPIVTIPLATSNLTITQNTKHPVIPGSDPESTPNFLIVSTIEPRKGHAQLLDAFELLWAEGNEYHLTIVGKEGWNVSELIVRLESHPQKDKHLHYKAFVEDTELQQLYKNATALIVSSYAEGFGLPLIEAAHYTLPIIARDIPVFHEIAKEAAFYFPDSKEPELLANAIKEWYKHYNSNSHPKSDTLTFFTWEQNAKKLLQALSHLAK